MNDGMYTYIFIRRWFLITMSLTMLISVPSMTAQGFGSIQGTVTDTTGAVVATSVVTAVQVETGTSTVINTNAAGLYVFPSLPPAIYSITVTAQGFEKLIRNNILLQANQAATENFSLQVGSTSMSVTVSSEALQVDTTTGTLSQVIDTQRVNELPLNGRNAAQLTTLVAGVVLAPNNGADQGQTKTFPVAVTVSINGSSADQTNYMLDGGNNIDEYTNVNSPFPFPDALREFSIQTANYDAQYGQNAGGVVNIVTKSGGKSFHGNLFEYVRNRVFNARNYFASTVDPLKRNQFGGTLGGPIILPHLVSGQHTFFFVGYQKTIVRDQQGGKSSFVPTQANLSGDFSALLNPSDPANPLPGQKTQIVNPFTGIPYSNNKIDPSTFDPAAVAFSKYLPNVTGNGQVFYQNPLKQDFNEVVVRGDHDLGQRDHIFARYYLNHFTNAGVLNTSNLLTYSDQADIRVQNALVDDTHTFNSRLLNNLSASYSREVSIRGPLSGAPNAATFGVNIYQPAQKSIQLITASGFFSIGDNPQAAFQRNNYTFSEDLHWVMGSHNFAFGGHGEVSKIDINSLFNQPGLFTFNSNTTNYALASLMLGYMYQFGQGSGQYFNNRNQFYGFYAQDSWQATRRLTFNYGLRYEPFWQWRELEHRTELFSPTAFAAGKVSSIYTNAPAGLLFVGDPGVPETGVHPVYTNFMPRVGFAYDVFGTGKTSLRGGAGSFYDTRQPGIMGGSTANSTPFSVAVTLTQPKGPFSNPYRGITNPFPAPSPAPSNLVFPSPVQAFTYDPGGNYQVPVTYAWNLTLEQQLSNSLAARLAYVGSHMSHALTSIELNPASYIPGSSLSTDARRHFLGYSNIVETAMGASGTYHSLQATLQRRVALGLSLTANYTFSKALNDIPYGSGLTGGSTNQSYVFPIYQPNYKSLDLGPADFDRRNVFTASYLWVFPLLGEGNGLLRAIVNGWQTTGIFQAFTGQPITITAGQDVSQTALQQDRAQYIGRNAYGAGACSSTAAHCENYLNPTSFALPATGTFGNVVKGSFRGPGYFDWDAGLFRSFPLKGESNLQFRAEYFNLLNRTNLLNPITAKSSGGFGSITSANDPRIAQLSLKVAF
jgi:hypothetical protein